MFLFNQEIKSRPRLRNHVKPFWFIHDAVKFIAREDKFQKAAEILKECMEVRTKEYITEKFGRLMTVRGPKVLDYPIDVEFEVGKNWAKMKEVKV